MENNSLDSNVSQPNVPSEIPVVTDSSEASASQVVMTPQPAQPSTRPVQPARFSSLSFLMGLLLAAVIGLLLVVAFGFGQYSSQPERELSDANEVVGDSDQLPETETDEMAMNTQNFQDLRVMNMSFNYDASVWSAPQPTAVDNAPSTQAWSMTDSSGGKLEIAYTLAFGQGGGIDLVTAQELFEHRSNHFRLLSNQSYVYGSKFMFDGDQMVVTEFSQDGGLAEVQTACEEQSAPGFEGMPIYQSEDCVLLEQGQVVASVQIPSFQWSYQFGRIAPLGEFNPEWANDSYIEQTGLSNRPIIAIVRYTGTHPEWADEIVNQLGMQ